MTSENPTAPPLERAHAGDEAAFAELVRPYRSELQLHCYRMLGSLQDAEDALQETLLAAWRGLKGFEGRSSLRTWLYQIATNRCLNFRRDRARRPQPAGLSFDPPPATRMSEISWLEPFPDTLLETLPESRPGPEARYELREAVGLAFITGLQRLPPRQRAALVLRDVLGFQASEAAEMLGVSEATVTSALQRARATMRERQPLAPERVPAPGSSRERELAERFADAFEEGDLDRVISLLTDDAWVTMPPAPFEYQGPEAVADFFAHVRTRRRTGDTRLLPTRANGQPAFGHYLRAEGETGWRLVGLLALVVREDGIAQITRFDVSNLSG